MVWVCTVQREVKFHNAVVVFCYTYEAISVCVLPLLLLTVLWAVLVLLAVFSMSLWLLLAVLRALLHCWSTCCSLESRYMSVATQVGHPLV